MINLIESIKSITEGLFKKKDVIGDKIKALQIEKNQKQNKLDEAFDKLAEAELQGKPFDNSIIKSLNAEISEISGKIEAFQRQLNKTSVEDDELEVLLSQAAEEYRDAAFEKVRLQLHSKRLSQQIYELLREGKELSRKIIYFNKDNEVIETLSRSGIFIHMDLKSEVQRRAGLLTNTEFIDLKNQLSTLFAEDRRQNPWD